MRPLLAVVLGAVVLALTAWVITYILDHATDAEQWVSVVVWVVAAILFVLWAFPRYFGSRWT
jgi:predicted membrane-bound spermidine synthase